MTWPNGQKYEGDWKDGEQTGKGIMKLTDGSYFDGYFIDEKLNG